MLREERIYILKTVRATWVCTVYEENENFDRPPPKFPATTTFYLTDPYVSPNWLRQDDASKPLRFSYTHRPY